MTRRCVDWNKGLAKDLRDPEFSRIFILEAIAEGMTLREIIGKVIRTIGVKEFSKKANMPASNIIRAISAESNPTQDTLNRLLKPLGLELTVALIRKKNRVA